MKLKTAIGSTFYFSFILSLKEIVAGQYDCDLYCINGLVLESRKRREHLSRDDLQKNKALMESFTKGHSTGIDQNGEVSVYFLLKFIQLFTKCKYLFRF